jgi:hypothetical protein
MQAQCLYILRFLMLLKSALTIFWLVLKIVEALN